MRIDYGLALHWIFCLSTKPEKPAERFSRNKMRYFEKLIEKIVEKIVESFQEIK